MYLDDVWVSGDDTAVARALDALRRFAPSIGLELNIPKCELIPAAGVRSEIDRSLFPSHITFPVPAIAPDVVGAFELLGAPVGPAPFCAAHTLARVSAVQPLLDELAHLPDPQVALRLLRNCAAFGKVAFSARVVEYGTHDTQLRVFDGQVRACFEEFTGLCPSTVQWDRAVLALRNGGLGLRRAAAHAAAAYAASCAATHRRCVELDRAFTCPFDAPGSAAALAIRNLNAALPVSAQIVFPVPHLRQQSLSLALEEASVGAMLAPDGGLDVRGRALLRLLRQPGAGAWLSALPSEA
eukprot:gene575-2533_t